MPVDGHGLRRAFCRRTTGAAGACCRRNDLFFGRGRRAIPPTSPDSFEGPREGRESRRARHRHLDQQPRDGARQGESVSRCPSLPSAAASLATPTGKRPRGASTVCITVEQAFSKYLGRTPTLYPLTP